jgi:hypothetical protein
MRRLAAAAVLLLLALVAAPGAALAGNPDPVVSIRTVPAVSGLALTFEKHRYVTDASGRVQIPRAQGEASIDVLPRIRFGQRLVDGDTKMRFARWFTVGSDFVAALDVFRRVSWSFVDSAGAPVASARVERVVLRSTSGEVRALYTGLDRPHWLYSRRVSLIRGHTQIKDVSYAVQRITVLGSDVVNAGQQTFTPEQQRPVRFTLAFFTLTVRGEDALFGSAVGTRARLVLPNGSTRELKLDHGRAVVPALPRGTYSVKLDDGLYRLAQPLVLSRSQVTVVPVVTWLDVLAVGGGLLLLAVGLVLVGRPYLARRARARLAPRRRTQAESAEPS